MNILRTLRALVLVIICLFGLEYNKYSIEAVIVFGIILSLFAYDIAEEIGRG